MNANAGISYDMPLRVCREAFNTTHGHRGGTGEDALVAFFLFERDTLHQSNTRTGAHA